MSKILIVDDERTARKGLYFILKSRNDEIFEAEGYIQAKKLIEQHEFDLMICDLHLPAAEDGLKLVRCSKQKHPLSPVLMITAYGSVSSAVEAMKAGADDYVTKDFSKEEIQIKIEKMLETKRLWLANIRLTEKVGNLQNKYLDFPESDPLIGESEATNEILNLIARIGKDNDSTVLITGESGTGKELVARAIHNASKLRKRQKFVVVDVASMPATLLESQLFGHEKGAFTNAVQKHIGFFETAHGGTVFLDEIGDFPLELQVKLLRFLQEKTFVRVGGESPITSDVRIVAATNKNLDQMVEQERFREDLYYRLNVINIRIPPLRERRRDIAPIVAYYRKKFEKIKGRTLEFPSAVLNKMESYDWPGNIRQLKNFIESLFVICPSDTVQEQDLNYNRLPDKNVQEDLFNQLLSLPLKEARQQLIERFEKSYLEHYFRQQAGNISKVAQQVGESREGVSKKIKRYEIKES